MQFRGITNLDYYVHIQIYKQRNAEKNIVNTGDNLFTKKNVNVDLHIDDVMTDS